MAPRVIAFYLPQFHPIPENDEWWGKGFTEWTNVGKAKKMFPGHYQPRVPADLGYYDLRLPEAREAQAELAREAGIEGFCYWHYWFGNGKRLLERPFNEVLESGKPDFPFCLAWANESWKGFAHGLTNRNVLIEQEYPGVEDYKRHFYAVLPALKDRRYIKVDDKPLFMIYKPLADPEIPLFITNWRALARENGLPGLYFVGQCTNRNDINATSALGFDAVNICDIGRFLARRSFIEKAASKIWRTFTRLPYAAPYNRAKKYFFDIKTDSWENIIPTIVSGWDHTPRSGRHGIVLTKYTPRCFGAHARFVIQNTKNGIVFLKSWNEWAEGNYMEPDLKWGKQFINELRAAVDSK
jgi:hypothetical protein